MKKRVIPLLLCIFLVACSSIPSGFSKETYEIGKEALSWCERFDNGKINEDEFEKQMDKLHSKAEKLEFDDRKENFNHTMVTADILFLSMTYMGKDSFYENYDRLKERIEGK